MKINKDDNVVVVNEIWTQNSANSYTLTIELDGGEYIDIEITISESDSAEDEDSLYFRYINMFMQTGDPDFNGVSPEELIKLVKKHESGLIYSEETQDVSEDLTIRWMKLSVSSVEWFTNICMIGTKV